MSTDVKTASGHAPAPTPCPSAPASAPKMGASEDGKGTQEEKPRALFAVDIECSGPHLVQHGIVAIGWCVGDASGRVLEKQRVSLSLDGKTFGAETKAEYWDRPEQAAQLAQFMREAIAPKEAMQRFIAAVDKWEETHRVSIVSDNPAYDVKWLDYYLAFFLNRYPLAYTKEKRYRGITEDRSMVVSKRTRRAGKWVFDNDKYAFGKELLRTTVPHNHWPENDAEYIYHHALLHDRCAFDLGTSH
jgi:hypothetical protein